MGLMKLDISKEITFVPHWSKSTWSYRTVPDVFLRTEAAKL